MPFRSAPPSRRHQANTTEFPRTRVPRLKRRATDVSIDGLELLAQVLEGDITELLQMSEHGKR